MMPGFAKSPLCLVQRFVVGAAILLSGSFAVAQRVAVAPASARVPSAVEMGEAPGSEPVNQVVISLKGSDAQQAALKQFLVDQVTPGSASYHQWLTPQQFADQFQPSEEATARVAQWFTSQGISVDGVNASRTALHVHGTVAQMERAFGSTISRVLVGSTELRTTANALTLPTAIAPSVASVDGVSETELRPDAFAALQQFAAAVEANTDAVLTLQSSATCSASEANALRDAFTPALQQAAAQGITVLVAGSCVTQALAPATGLATAVHLKSEPVDTAVSLATDGTERPTWQVAEGLPDSTLRAVPDVSVDGDLSVLANAFRTIVSKAGARQGNANATLYALSAEKGIYTQPNAGTVWQSGTGLGVVNPQDLIDAWPLGSTTTSVSLSSDNYSPTHGSNFTLTATVQNAGSGTAAPTGVVTFSSQSATLGTATLAPSGSATSKATYTVSGIDGGSYTFNASYPGDTNYAAGATTSPAIVAVIGEPSSVSATTTQVSLGASIPVVVTVSSTSGVGTPTGTVTVAPQGTSSSTTYTGTLAQVSAGVARATVSVPSSQAGAVTMLVNCANPSSSFTCYTPVSVQATVDKGTPTVALTFTPSGTSSGSGTLKATMTGATGAVVPSGTILFYDGATQIGTGSTIAGGSATQTASFTGTTAHQITATYNGDNNYLTATSNGVTVTGTLVNTTTSLTSSSYSSSYGTSITLNSTVTPASTVNGTAPTGTITFTSSLQGVVGTAPYTGTALAFPIATLQAGTHTLTATYSGDSNYAPSTSTSSVVVTVGAAVGTLAATISPTTSVGYGTSATVNVTVTTASGSTPAGTVTATVNGVAGAVYSGTLIAGTGSSTAAITIPSPVPGTYTVTVACQTTTSLSCNNTVTLPLKVVQGATSTALSITPSAPQAGMKVTLTAVVSPATASVGTFGDITGTVSFFDNGVSLGSAPLTSSTASINVRLSGKTHALTAKYSGDTKWAASTSDALTVTPTALDGTLAITANNLGPLAGANVILTATMTAPAGATIIPTGTILFYDVVNGTQKLLGSASLISNGVDGASASISTTGFVGGTHVVYATYAGDSSFNAARSADLTIATGDFALSMNPPTLTLTRGTAGVATGTITLLGGFSGTVTLGCTPPANTETTCSFGPSVVSGGGATTLSIVTKANTAMAKPVHKSGWPAEAALALLVGCGFAACRKRRLPALLLAVLLSIFAVGTSGCADGILSGNSGGGTPGGGSDVGNGTPLGTMVFTLTAAATDGSTTARHQYFYQVTVQ